MEFAVVPTIRGTVATADRAVRAGLSLVDASPVEGSYVAVDNETVVVQ